MGSAIPGSGRRGKSSGNHLSLFTASAVKGEGSVSQATLEQQIFQVLAEAFNKREILLTVTYRTNNRSFTDRMVTIVASHFDPSG